MNLLMAGVLAPDSEELESEPVIVENIGYGVRLILDDGTELTLSREELLDALVPGGRGDGPEVSTDEFIAATYRNPIEAA